MNCVAFVFGVLVLITQRSTPGRALSADGGRYAVDVSATEEVRLSVKSMPLAPRSADSLEHLQRSSHSGFAYSLRAVVKDSATFRELWARAVRGQPAPPPLPRIDFDRDMVIVAAMGEQPSTGAGIRIDSVVVRGAFVQIHIVLGVQGSPCLVNPAITNPVDIVKAPKQPGVVVFHERQVQHECNFP